MIKFSYFKYGDYMTRFVTCDDIKCTKDYIFLYTEISTNGAMMEFLKLKRKELTYFNIEYDKI